MYYILEKRKDKTSIVRNFEKHGFEKIALMNYLNEKDIKLIESKEDMEGEGSFCIEDGLNHYLIYVMKKDYDGYIFCGAIYQEEMYSLDVVYFKNEKNKRKEICADVMF